MFNNTRSILKKTENTNNMIEKIEFVNEANLKLLLDTIESKFSDAINECFTTFSDISSPILSVSDIDELIELYKTQLPLHYRTMSRILGIDQKQNVTRNLHLVQSGYYDRMIFYNFLSQCRIKCPDNCVSWAIVAAASIYSRGLGDSIQKRATYCGISSSIKTYVV